MTKSGLIDRFSSDYEEYYDFVRTFRIKSLLAIVDTNLDEIGMLSLIAGKKVVFLVGA